MSEHTGEVFAGIPYHTFPDFEIGPLTIRTFGTMVGIGVVLGAWVAARYIERFGVPREDTYRLATRMVVAGLIGSRVTWVLSHLDEIDNPIDVIAVWEGGIQFSGGFIAAVLVGFPTFRTWTPVTRWRSLDGYAYGLTIGLAIGRIGCYSVGEHFGRATEFFLGTTYEGGSTQEPIPLPGGGFAAEETARAIGATFHNTSLYEFLHLLVLFGIMTLLIVRARSRGDEVRPGTLMGIFAVWYGLARIGTDALRVNDERVLGLTGAQWGMLTLALAGVWILVRVRPGVAALVDAQDHETDGDGDGRKPDGSDELSAEQTVTEPAPADAESTD